MFIKLGKPFMYYGTILLCFENLGILLIAHSNEKYVFEPWMRCRRHSFSRLSEIPSIALFRMEHFNDFNCCFLPFSFNGRCFFLSYPPQKSFNEKKCYYYCYLSEFIR